ncbi:DUF6875 domain-containing protein [Kutzneria sp. CA-103260]|uniref:DUF6875 domain-containing protein n=1 Tax=Kutzneria sp. CA-103260 TaxID=2802641 RepID=UPI001BABF154|nr:hypothetical protein [Kutzneria sp. CA-103260]QUQ64345.1 hypothetical protein JJ691_20650 [Kutzneria sp. CA-103260]
MTTANPMPPLYRDRDIELLGVDLPVLRQVDRWCHEFLMRPNPELGRGGSVCPYLPKAMGLQRIALTVVHTAGRTDEDVDAVIARFRQVFLEMEPVSGPESLEKAILVILPDVSEQDAPAMVDETHRRLKADFVAAGLMIGKFHPASDQGGLHNPDFRPLRSPVPLLAIRYMVGSDLPFLNRPDDPVSDRVQYLTSYEQRFDGADGGRWAEHGRAALTEIRDGERG